MKRAAIAASLAGMVLLVVMVLLRGSNQTAAADPHPESRKEPNKLKTSGSATVRVKPDAARVFFGVQTSAATIKDARTDNNQRVRKVLAALTALKIPDLKSKTSDVQVEILYDRAKDARLPPIVGYRITTTFTVLVQDERRGTLGASAARVLDAALEHGANQVQQIAFLSKEGTTQTRRQALTRAVEDALANARALAAGAKKDQVTVISIEDAPVYGSRNTMTQLSNVAIPQGGDAEAALVVGDLEVTCHVNVICTY